MAARPSSLNVPSMIPAILARLPPAAQVQIPQLLEMYSPGEIHLLKDLKGTGMIT